MSSIDSHAPNLIAGVRSILWPRGRISISRRLMQIGALITLMFTAIALLTPLLTQMGLIQNPNELLSNPIHEPPSSHHWFGTTRQGYDVFSRTLFGAQAALKVVILATALSVVIGVPLGLLGGYLRGVGRSHFAIRDGCDLHPARFVAVDHAGICRRAWLV